MSADTLRRAAATIRDEWGPTRGGSWSAVQNSHLAVADWLDDIAERHQPTEVYTVASLDMDADTEDAFLARVQAGSSSLGQPWTEHVVEDVSGNIIVSDEPPVAACTHRPQDEMWPCPEISKALAVATAYLGEQP